MTQYVKICPKCGSLDISFYGIRGIHLYCKDCNFGKFSSDGQNPFFPEINIENVADFQKQLKKNDKLNPSKGK